METFVRIMDTLWSTVLDVAPILLVLILFQVFVLRQTIPNLKRMVLGFVYVVIGLDLFLVGLDLALFPLGRLMAAQLTDPAFLGATPGPGGEPMVVWTDYLWVYVFAAAVGFATTVAEPALIAVAIKVEEVSGGAIRAWGLRAAVALGVSIGVALGTLRIVIGAPLPWFIVAGYVVVIGQTFFAPKAIIPLAYDSGGVTTSTVTVPLVTALGLGLASSIPGRSPLIDGFGLIALASLFPMITVMGYAQVGDYVRRRAARLRRAEEASVSEDGGKPPKE
ncbi:MAG: DUF1538 domain-containing protein [Rhodospirillum sp.]|nr:DUF1538 domain-containing protein [Rhodospirillum sp.]MCF8490701.1 DUF1538 domain-containing protein [Rhodospirillum sp.]MCF8499400.1 DUF1538 domain-containing protein [Rhodospirillum sp.]